MPREPVGDFFPPGGETERLLTDALNACYTANASNTGRQVAEFMRDRFLTGAVENVSVSLELDGRGGWCLSVCLQLFDGLRASARSRVLPTLTPHPSTVRQTVSLPSEKRTERAALEALRKKCEEELNDALASKPLSDLTAVDCAISTADGTENCASLGSNVCGSASMAAASLHAKLRHRSLFTEISSMFRAHRGQPASYTVPLPMVTLFSAGEPPAFGKTRIRELCIVCNAATPCHTALQQCARVVHEAIAKASDDGNPSLTLDGAVKYTAFESIGAGIDIVEDCIKEAGLVPGIDVFIGVIVDGAWCAKADKYSITDGPELSGAQHAEALASIVRDRKSVAYLEDTHHPADRQEMRRLMSRLGNTTTVAGVNLFGGSEETASSGAHDCICNAIGVRVTEAGTTTKALNALRAFTTALPGSVVVAVHDGCDLDGPFLAEYAVGTEARFLRAGGLLRSDSAAAYNRLCAIEASLERCGQLGTHVAAPHANVQVPPAPAEAVAEVPAKGDKRRK